MGAVKIHPDGKPADSLIFASGGRFYINLSQMFTVYSAKNWAKSIKSSETDVLLGELFDNVDETRYKAMTKIDVLRWGNLLRYIPRTFWYARHTIKQTLSALWNPERFFPQYEEIVGKTVNYLKQNTGSKLSVRDFICKLNEDLIPIMIEVVLPVLAPYLYYFWRVDKLFGNNSEEDKQCVDSLKMGFAGN